MASIIDLFSKLAQMPHYSFGWLIVSALAIIPALVSGNMLQHSLTKLFKGEATKSILSKDILINFLVLSICVAILAYTIYLYL